MKMPAQTQTTQSAPLITPVTYRIIGLQILFLGLLFLPEMSIYPLKFAVAEYSVVMKTLQYIVDNPYFYGLLMLTTLIMMFSFDVKVNQETLLKGRISLGGIVIKALGKILVIYLGLYAVSWLFLIYKMRFMGEVYINHFLLQ